MLYKVKIGVSSSRRSHTKSLLLARLLDGSMQPSGLKLPTLAQRKKQNKYYAHERDGIDPEVMKLESFWLAEASRMPSMNQVAETTPLQPKPKKKTYRKQPGGIYRAENKRLQLNRKKRVQAKYA